MKHNKARTLIAITLKCKGNKMSGSIALHTKYCIVTGKPATCWTGHLSGKGYGPIRDDGRMPLLTVGVIAGFADYETSQQAKSDGFGCFGDFEHKYGLAHDSIGGHSVIEQVANGDFVSMSTALLNRIQSENQNPRRNHVDRPDATDPSR